MDGIVYLRYSISNNALKICLKLKGEKFEPNTKKKKIVSDIMMSVMNVLLSVCLPLPKLISLCKKCHLFRYGLPVNFQAMLLQPNKRTMKKLREVLYDLYKHLDSSAAAIIDVSSLYHNEVTYRFCHNFE